MAQKGLKANQLKKVSSPAPVYKFVKAEVAGLSDSISDDFALKPAAVDELGVTVDLVGVDGTGSNAAPLVETESRLDAIEAKLDELIAALKS